MPRTGATDQICRDCWDRAIYAYGTAEIFLRRSRRYRELLRALAFVGTVVPLLVGGFVMGFGLQSAYLPTILAAAAALGLFQLAFSAWSIVYSWADNLEYALRSTAENFHLSAEFKELGATATDPPANLETRFAALKARDDVRRADDATKGVSPKEFRYGHRAGLRQFSKACSECKAVPTSMESTNCPVCGRF
jgi:mobilome CxxCx(11)CxxC protein